MEISHSGGILFMNYKKIGDLDRPLIREFEKEKVPALFHESIIRYTSKYIPNFSLRLVYFREILWKGYN